MKKWIRVLLTACLLCASGLPLLAMAHSTNSGDDIDRGLHWLSQQQQADGAFRTVQTSANDWQTSQEALQAFANADQLSHFNSGRLLQFMDSQINPATEFLSRRIMSRLRLGLDITPDLTLLRQRQNEDGGFGSEAGYDSSVYDTLFALQVLANTGNRASPVTAAAIGYLTGQQKPDGSFSLDTQTAASPYITALVIRSLYPYLYVFNIGDNLSRAQNYLYSQTAQSSSWGSDWEAAQFLLAVVPVTTDSSRYQGTLNWLRIQQQSNGSWQNDPFATALALQALYLSANITLPTEPDKAIIRGRLIDAASGQPLAGASIGISPGNPVLSNAQGEFLFNGLEAGSYRLTYQADGYQSLTQTFNVRAAQLADAGTIAMSLLPTSGLLSGSVTDASDGSALVNARIRIDQSGSSNDVLTDTNGRYQISVPAGAASITVSASGYQTVQANATFTAGSSVNFPVQLTRDNEPVQPLLLSGRIIDADTQQPLAEVLVEQLSNNTSTQTDAEGRFSLTGATAGEQQIRITRSGYQGVQLGLVLPASGRADLGTVQLQPATTATVTTLQGQITDGDSGAPIAAAQVSIDGLSVLTDADGYYRLDDISRLDFVVGVRAAGYVFGSVPVSISQPGILTLNVVLLPADSSGILVSSVDTDETAYGAYQRVGISATLTNQTVRERRLMLYVLVQDSAGHILDRFPAAEIPAPPRDDSAEAWAHYQQHIDEATEVLVPNESRRIELEMGWNTGRQIPGAYRLTVQALDAATSQVMAEQSSPLHILPTRRISTASAVINPSFALMGQETELQLAALLRNASNQPLQAELTWELSSPADQQLEHGSLTLQLQPEDVNREIVLQSLTTTFAQSGDYRLRLSIAGNAETGPVSPAVLFVPPTVRLTVEQDLTPQQVLPGSSRRSQVRIQIKGVDGE